MFLNPDGGGNVAVTLARALNARLMTCQLDAAAFADAWFGGNVPVSLQAYDTAPRWLRFSSILQMQYALIRLPRLAPRFTIFSGSLSLLAHKRIAGPKILYCHTPPRLLYDQRRFYLNQVPWYRKPVMMALMMWYRTCYETAVRDMDLIIANSRNVQGRIKQFLGRESLIVYPPCDIDSFEWLGQEDFYLSTARLDPLKQVDRVVKAFLQMPDKNLVVVSGGSEWDPIRQLAAGAANITVRGWVDGPELRCLMGNCIATIYIARDEDFGMSPVESMAAGKPVIGAGEGGLLETVIDGETGMLLPVPTVDTLTQAIQAMTPARARAMAPACLKQAAKFSRQRFLDQFNSLLGGGS
jgi:glycosyltransferase involved in cell wall biosynthesis